MTSAEQPAPYGSGPAAAGGGTPGTSSRTPAKVRVHHLQQMKERGERWAMLTAYEQYAAEIFDEAGIPVLLVGDSAANNVYGYETSLPVTVDEMLVLVRAVTRSVRRALVVADLPFGSYQQSVEQAVATSTRFMKEGRAHAVKLEGGHRVVETVRRLVDVRHPRHGARRLHPPERARPRRLPGAGTRQGRRRAAGRRDRAAGRRRLRDRDGDGARAAGGRGHQGRWPSRPSASARARTATPRCWSGRTWPACAGARPRGS